MKKLLSIAALGIFIISCGEEDKKNDKPVIKEERLEGVREDETNNSDQCSFQQILNDPETPGLAKNIYLDKDWDLKNEDKAIALIDSMKSGSKKIQPFYFKVVTKSHKKADGAYAEVLSNAAKEYVENNTAEFLSYFDDKLCFTNTDLIAWADMIILELAIIADGKYYEPIVSEYARELEQNCASCSADQKTKLRSFVLMLKLKWEKATRL